MVTSVPPQMPLGKGGVSVLLRCCLDWSSDVVVVDDSASTEIKIVATKRHQGTKRWFI